MSATESDILATAEILHGLWWSAWYEEHGGHFSGGTDIIEVMPPVPEVVKQLAAKVWELYPAEGANKDNSYYPKDLAYSITGNGGASGYSDMEEVGYDLEQLRYDLLHNVKAGEDPIVCLGHIPANCLPLVPDGTTYPCQIIKEYDDSTWTNDALTPRDMTHLLECLERRKEDNARQEDDPEYDEGGPEDVMTSLGYVSLWIDGEVTWGRHGSVKLIE